MEVPILVIKDKQAFSTDGRVIGNPVFVARRFFDDGAKLIHIIDRDALMGLSTNMDIYDKLTYFVNVQVECAQNLPLIHKLLSFKCRVVIRSPFSLDFSALEEKKLLVLMISNPADLKVSGDFFDLILADYSPDLFESALKLKKRIMVFGKDLENVPEKYQKKIFGVISDFSD
ncbi:hypothetical protein HY990_02475 [Candidatus Micrarchaeota archaeon]|nr:hypothetical protein [Candidatus Micrarchaeota archaeon]